MPTSGKAAFASTRADLNALPGGYESQPEGIFTSLKRDMNIPELDIHVPPDG
jgi:hypothetical protein